MSVAFDSGKSAAGAAIDCGMEIKTATWAEDNLDIDLSYVGVYEFWGERPIEEVRVAVADNFDKQGCGCEHDCCGCLFRQSVQVLRTYEGQDFSYYIIDKWFRNL